MATAIILPRTSLVIAPADASDRVRRKADLKCTGTDDQEINEALASVARDGTVSLLRGTFRVGGAASGGLQHPGHCVLAGTGWDTVIEMGDSNAESLSASSPRKHLISPASPEATARTLIRVQNLKLRGRAASQYGNGPIGLQGAKHGIALLNAAYARVTNVWAEDFDGDGCYIGTPQTGTYLVDIPGVAVRDCVFAENFRNGLMVAHGSDVLIENNLFLRNQKGVAEYILGANTVLLDFEGSTHSFTGSAAAVSSSTDWGYRSGRSLKLVATGANATATRSTTVIPASLHRLSARVRNETSGVRTVKMQYNGADVAGPFRILPRFDTTLSADLTGTGAAADIAFVWTDSVNGDAFFVDQVRVDELAANPKYDTNTYASAEIDIEPNLFSIGHQRAREIRIVNNRFIEGRNQAIQITRPGYDTSHIDILDNTFIDNAAMQINHNSRSAGFLRVARNRFVLTGPGAGSFHFRSHGPADLILADNIFEGVGFAELNKYAIGIDSDGGSGLPDRPIIRGNKFDFRNATAATSGAATIYLTGGVDAHWSADNQFVAEYGFVDARYANWYAEPRILNAWVADNLLNPVIGAYPNRTVIDEVIVQTIEAWNNSAASLIVGIAGGDTDGLVETVDISTVGVKAITGVLRGYQANGATLTALVTNAGAASTVGKTLIMVRSHLTSVVT